MKSKIFLILNNAIFKSKFSNLAGFSEQPETSATICGVKHKLKSYKTIKKKVGREALKLTP